MKSYVLRTEGLTKKYKKVDALSNVSIALEPGKIYGLIGQNGAGKTTLMRLIAGISYATSGTIELFGHVGADGADAADAAIESGAITGTKIDDLSGEKALMAERKRIGCMIEYPSIHGNMTAKDNLKFHRIMKGIPNAEIEMELLERVGLADTGRKKAKDFSLGMKQRLGIAVSLLGSPEILILDEPINGLDPIGVVEVRKLLLRLCEERQITILISSHNLPELYQTATDYIIIHKGEIKKTLTLKELEDNCKRHLLISTDEPEKLVGVLEMALGTSNFIVLPNKSVKLFDFLDEKERISRVLFENGIMVTNLLYEGESLEDYFVSIVGGEGHV
ncbi:MAG: ATP-binding cassette domain-containing protein [Vallitaleaceae bacterium]|jgi:ABC-2 type transport system ATP-binding protein|nr:ATP-binding cassette domain-containing protein [Vallitaleaceae bacterium]